MLKSSYVKPAIVLGSFSRAGGWVLAIPLCAGLLLSGCKKSEPPPPLPEHKEPAPVEQQPVTLAPEDAGAPKAPEPAATPKPAAKAGSSTNLSKCCVALKQNAANAPEPTKGYMLYAATICEASAAAGKSQASMVKILETALRGAGLPAGCK